MRFFKKLRVVAGTAAAIGGLIPTRATRPAPLARPATSGAPGVPSYYMPLLLHISPAPRTQRVLHAAFCLKKKT